MTWWIFAILSAIFAALTAIFAKLGVSDMNSNLATAIRTVIVLVMIWLIVWVRGEWRGMHSISRLNILFLVLSGIATGLSWIFYFKALQSGPVSLVSAVDKLSLALTIILAVLFLGETLSWRTALGALFIISGTLILIAK